MLRQSLFGLSTLALMTATACAQEDQNKISGADPAANAHTESATSAKSEAKILDAAQVNTRDEAKLYAESEFKQADINKDGSVDKNEFLAYAVIRAPIEDPMPEGVDEPVTVEGDETASTEEPANAEEQFAEISNGDEKISETEMIESRVAQFDEADTNDDAQLDPEERKQFIKLSQLKPSSSTSL